MAEVYVDKELCEEKMKGNDEKLNKIINNDLPHIRSDISKLDGKIDSIEEKVIELKTNSDWTMRGMIGLYAIIGSAFVTLIVSIIKGWI